MITVSEGAILSTSRPAERKAGSHREVNLNRCESPAICPDLVGAFVFSRLAALFILLELTCQLAAVRIDLR